MLEDDEEEVNIDALAKAAATGLENAMQQQMMFVCLFSARNMWGANRAPSIQLSLCFPRTLGPHVCRMSTMSTLV